MRTRSADPPAAQQGSRQRAAAIAEHLRRRIELAGYDLTKLSRDTLGRAPDYLSKMLRGERIFRVVDLCALLVAIDLAPADFFGELYDLYRPEQLSAEIVPGMFEGQVRRLIEQVAHRTATEETAGQERAATQRARRVRPPRARTLP